MFGIIRQHGVSKNGIKATKRSPPENLTRWIIIQSKTFTRKGIEKKSESFGTYICFVLTFQVQDRLTIVKLILHLQ